MMFASFAIFEPTRELAKPEARSGPAQAEAGPRARQATLKSFQRLFM
jgi:hypothetical protein